MDLEETKKVVICVINELPDEVLPEPYKEAKKAATEYGVNTDCD